MSVSQVKQIKLGITNLTEKYANEMIVRNIKPILLDSVLRCDANDVAYACQLLNDSDVWLSNKCVNQLIFNFQQCPPNSNASCILQSILSLGLVNEYKLKLLSGLKKFEMCHVLPIIESGFYFENGEDITHFASSHIIATILLIAQTGSFAPNLRVPDNFRVNNSHGAYCGLVARTFGVCVVVPHCYAFNPEKVVGETKRLMIGEEGLAMLFGLQSLNLPALVLLEILDCAAPLSIYLPIHYRYNFVCLVKHFHDKR
jgi:hypothetical protein